MNFDLTTQLESRTCSLSTDQLLAIIRFQTEVAKLRLDLEEVVQRTARLAQELTQAAGATVELAEEDAMVLRALSGTAANLQGLRLPRDASLSGLCVEQGRALLCVDSDQDPRVNREVCRRLGLRSVAVVPLRHQGACVGVLKVLSPEPRAFGEAQVQALELVSEVVGAALAHASEFANKIEEARDLFLQASRDHLTGLGSRALFYDRLHTCLAMGRRSGQRCGVAVLDMDGLKAINDTCGHPAGDEALRILAERLVRGARSSDTLARLGGDEFAVLLATIRDPVATRGYAQKLAERIQGPFQAADRTFDLRVSVGIAVFPDDAQDADTLLAAADEAMYRMKREHKAGQATR